MPPKMNCRPFSLVTALTLLVASVSWGQTGTGLYSFAGGPSDGSFPTAGLVFDRYGVAYGTTTSGGTYGSGTVFMMSPPTTGNVGWTETVLYNFAGGVDGGGPFAGVVLDKTGSLYGVTVGGGTGSCYYQGFSGCGTVYKLSPPPNLEVRGRSRSSMCSLGWTMGPTH